MKFCSRPFEYLYLDNYKGDVSLCQWMKREYIFIGNLLQKSFDDIWYGEKAQNCREYIRRGDYSICRFEACPFLQNDSLPEKTIVYARAYPVTETPKVVNLAYDFMCNQYCETCREKKWQPILPRYKIYMDRIYEQILPVLNRVQKITTSGHGDPFASPYMMRVLQNMKPSSRNMQLLLETNGVYCDEQHWRKLRHLYDCQIEVVLTCNSYNKFTYEHISRGGNFDKLMENLQFVKTLRKLGIVNSYVMSFVIQDRNFREIPSFIEKSFEKFCVDSVVLKPVYQWGTMPEDVFWFKDVLNPLHPYHAEYLEILDHPAMQDPRVFNFGGRTLHPATQFPGVKPNNPLLETAQHTARFLRRAVRSVAHK